jgi:hypothetical protein
MFDNVKEFMICAMVMWIWARGMWIYRRSTGILNNGQVRLTQEEFSIVPYAAGTKKRQNCHVITIEFLLKNVA